MINGGRPTYLLALNTPLTSQVTNSGWSTKLAEEAEVAEFTKSTHKPTTDAMVFLLDRRLRKFERRTFRSTFLLSVAFLILGSVVTIFVQNWIEQFGWLR
jgi:hypothetical protein